MLNVTYHAQCRQAARNVSETDIAFVWQYGQRIRCAGVLHVFLGRRNIPADKVTQKRFSHLEGTVLIVDDTGADAVLITVYRNRQALKHIRSKAKADRSSRARRHTRAEHLTRSSTCRSIGIPQ